MSTKWGFVGIVAVFAVVTVICAGLYLLAIL